MWVMGDAGERASLLRGVPIFASCGEREISRLAALLSPIEVVPGETLAREGEPGQGLILIAEGRAAASLGDKRVATFGPGSFFGQIELLERSPYRATLAAETSMRVYVLGTRGFQALIDQSPALARALLRSLALGLREKERDPALPRGRGLTVPQDDPTPAQPGGRSFPSK